MMLSRCPSCDTVFRVTPEQLNLRQGMVRCGRCGEAFNARENPATSPASTAPPVAAERSPARSPAEAAAARPAVPAQAPPERAFQPLPAPQPTSAFPAVDVDFPPLLDSGMADSPAAGPTAALPPAAPEPLPAAVPVPGPDSVAASVPAQPDAAPRTEVAVEVESAPKPAEQAAPDMAFQAPDEVGLPAEGEPAAPSRRGMLFLTALVILLAVAALLQLAVALRQPIVRAFPGFRPPIEALCEALGCALELPSHAELVTIETSDLQPQGGSKERLVLGATLRNRADFAQQLPHLELTLTDARDRALARRVFAPGDYLPSGSDGKAGLAARAELPVHLVLDATGVGASGYRLYVFYP